MNRYWLSFCDPDAPKKFLGACIVGPCVDFGEAVRLAHLRKCNPGGEVLGALLPAEVSLEPGDMHKLMSREECETLDARLAKQVN